MARIIRTDSVRGDVSTIAAYIAADNLPAAERWLETLDKTLAMLANNPLMGEQVDNLALGIRRHCYGNYLIFYRPLPDGIELRRVLHGARKMEDLF